MYGLVVSQWPNFQTSFHVRAWSHQKRRSGIYKVSCVKLAKTQRTVTPKIWPPWWIYFCAEEFFYTDNI